MKDFKAIKTIYNASSRQLDLALGLKDRTLSNFGTTTLYIVPSKENADYLFKTMCNTLNSQNGHYKAYKSSKEINYDNENIIIKSIDTLEKRDIVGRRFKKVYFIGEDDKDENNRFVFTMVK